MDEKKGGWFPKSFQHMYVWAIHARPLLEQTYSVSLSLTYAPIRLSSEYHTTLPSIRLRQRFSVGLPATTQKFASIRPCCSFLDILYDSKLRKYNNK